MLNPTINSAERDDSQKNVLETGISTVDNLGDEKYRSKHDYVNISPQYAGGNNTSKLQDDANPFHGENVRGSNDEINKVYNLQYPVGILKVTVNIHNNFLFHDYDNVYMGEFNIDDIIYYIIIGVSRYHNIQTMIKKLDDTKKKLIELTICKYAIDTNKLILNVTSPFMNEIELLLILNKMFSKLNSEYINDITNGSDIMQEMVYKISYSIMEHTINKISILSQQLKNSDDHILKNKLIGYSISLIYKMTQFGINKLDAVSGKYRTLNSTLDKLMLVENELNAKILLLERKNSG